MLLQSAVVGTASVSVEMCTIARTLPEKAKVVELPLYMPSSLRWPMFICTAAWSFAVISLLVQALQYRQAGSTQAQYE